MTTDLEKRRAIEQHWAASEAGDVNVEHRLYAEDAVLDYPTYSVSIKEFEDGFVAHETQYFADRSKRRRRGRVSPRKFLNSLAMIIPQLTVAKRSSDLPRFVVGRNSRS
jgi:ketosteroid isomerase-like protein